MTSLLTTIPYGLLVGLLLGALGAGGSVVTVPILVYALHEGVQTATATSLLIVATTAAAGAASHFRAGTVRLRTAAALSAVAAAGSAAGAALRAMTSERGFLLAFAALLAVIAALLWRTPRPNAGAMRECVLRPGFRDCSRLGFAGVAVGLLTGFFGVGGGFVIMPALVLILSFPARDAIGTSLVVVSLASLLALVPSLHHGSIEWETALPFAAGGVGGALLGARISRILPEALTRRAFALALMILAVFITSRNVSRSSPGPEERTPLPSTGAAGRPPICTLVAAAGPRATSECDRSPATPPVCSLQSCPVRLSP